MAIDNVADVMRHLQRFDSSDYLVFVAMLLLCILIGIYFGLEGRRRKRSSGPHATEAADDTAEQEYLMGGRTMAVFPIALSLIASFISGITLLGLPTEIYSFGVQYVYVMGGVVLMGVVVGRIFLPVFHGLQITSTYEYLEKRFDRRLRMFGSVMFVIMNVGYLPIVVYVPALAFNQVTGVNIHIITPVVCVVCVFYTCLGGLKAVVWTDVVQSFAMFGALLLVAVKGTMDLGGADIVWNSAWESGRIEAPNFSLNPTIRHTIWSQLFGGVVYWSQTNAVSQNMIQRYLALPSLRAARQALWAFVGGVVALMALCTYNGLLIYATYRHCDPLTTRLARANDQLLPLFVMDVLGEMPGLTGLFIAGVFSAALSSLSTCLNSMSAVVLEDFCKPFAVRPLSERAVNWIMRSVVVGMGVLCVALVVVVQQMGTVLQLQMSLEAITNGPLMGIFAMAVLMPWINGNCALLGGIVSVLTMGWVSLNAQWAIASGALRFEHKPMAVDQCTYDFEAISLANATALASPDDIFPLYRMSYMWYTFFGTAVAIAVAHLGAVILGRNRLSDIDGALVAPFLRSRCSQGPVDKVVDQRRPLPPHILGDDTCSASGDVKSRVFLSRVAALNDESAL